MLGIAAHGGLDPASAELRLALRESSAPGPSPWACLLLPTWKQRRRRAPHHIQKRSWPSEHTEPGEQSLPTCSENPAVDRCPATAGVDVDRSLEIATLDVSVG